MTFAGPAIVEERDSTAVIGPDATVTVDRFTNLLVDLHYHDQDEPRYQHSVAV
jgi:N-methylhydantoinase A/oxoprolinase/acetone carboxylase beta subunit